MKKKTVVTKEVAKEIKTLKKQKLTYNQIAKKLKLTYGQVKYQLSK